MYKKSKAKGFTLVELIVAIAILGILAASFLTMFSNGYISLFNAGNRTRAVKAAETLLDIASKSGNPDIIGSKSKESDIANLYTFAGSIDNSRYIHKTVSKNGESHEELTIVVFYRNGKGYTTLTSLIPSGGI